MPWPLVVLAAAAVFAAVFWWMRRVFMRMRAGRAGRAASLYAVADEKRMQLRGLHHVTAICRDLEQTIAFYRDLLGLAVVHDGPSDDDPSRATCGSARSRAGPGSS